MCVCVCVCQGCVLIRETRVCPWAAAEGHENLVVLERRGWDKSGKPAKHPLCVWTPSRAHTQRHAHSCTQQFTGEVHKLFLELAPFLLANDTMVTEQSASPCVSWPSLVTESKVTTGTTLGRRRAVGRLRRAAGGGVEGAGGG